MSNLRVVHRHTNKSKAKEMVKGFIGALFIAIAVGAGITALVECIKDIIK